jgi:transposase
MAFTERGLEYLQEWSINAAWRPRGLERMVTRFSTATRDLLDLADWLETQKITHVAMEATGVYWKPIWHILEGRFALVLANAALIPNVPVRKNDVNDATWIADA